MLFERGLNLAGSGRRIPKPKPHSANGLWPASSECIEQEPIWTDGKWCRESDWEQHKEMKIPVKVQWLRFYSRAFGAQLHRQEKGWTISTGKFIIILLNKWNKLSIKNNMWSILLKIVNMLNMLTDKSNICQKILQFLCLRSVSVNN
jgi:hypothetical protein